MPDHGVKLTHDQAKDIAKSILDPANKDLNAMDFSRIFGVHVCTIYRLGRLVGRVFPRTWPALREKSKKTISPPRTHVAKKKPRLRDLVAKGSNQGSGSPLSLYVFSPFQHAVSCHFDSASRHERFDFLVRMRQELEALEAKNSLFDSAQNNGVSH